MTLHNQIQSARDLARDRLPEALDAALQYLDMAYGALRGAETYASQCHSPAKHIEEAMSRVDEALGEVKSAREEAQ